MVSIYIIYFIKHETKICIILSKFECIEIKPFTRKLTAAGEYDNYIVTIVAFFFQITFIPNKLYLKQ